MLTRRCISKQAATLLREKCFFVASHCDKRSRLAIRAACAGLQRGASCACSITMSSPVSRAQGSWCAGNDRNCSLPVPVLATCCRCSVRSGKARALRLELRRSSKIEGSSMWYRLSSSEGTSNFRSRCLFGLLGCPLDGFFSNCGICVCVVPRRSSCCRVSPTPRATDDFDCLSCRCCPVRECTRARFRDDGGVRGGRCADAKGGEGGSGGCPVSDGWDDEDEVDVAGKTTPGAPGRSGNNSWIDEACVPRLEPGCEPCFSPGSG